MRGGPRRRPEARRHRPERVRAGADARAAGQRTARGRPAGARAVPPRRRDQPGHRRRPDLPVHAPAPDGLEPRRRGRRQLPGRGDPALARLPHGAAQRHSRSDSIVLSGPGATRRAAGRGAGRTGPACRSRSASRSGRSAPHTVPSRRRPVPLHRGRRPGAGGGRHEGGQPSSRRRARPRSPSRRPTAPPSRCWACSAGWCWRCSLVVVTQNQITDRKQEIAEAKQETAGRRSSASASLGLVRRVRPDQADPRAVGQRAGQDTLRLGAADARAGAGAAQGHLADHASTALRHRRRPMRPAAPARRRRPPQPAAGPSLKIVGCAKTPVQAWPRRWCACATCTAPRT